MDERPEHTYLAAGDALPAIDLQRCTGCGRCAELCPVQAVEMIHGKPVITHPAACTYCEICESYCPEDAIQRPFTITFASPHTHP